MAKNQRQRRPLQDEGRTEKKTARERAQASRRQRDRIEENRDRREQRRDRQRLRRQTVDSVRSPKEDVRTERFDSRLVPIEDTFLGRPVGMPTDLPVVIGERWYLGSNQSIPGNGTVTTVTHDTSVFTTERNGYPALYQGSGVFRIPAGLRGIWLITAAVHWSGQAGGDRITYLEFTDNTDIAWIFQDDNSGHALTQVLTTQYIFNEGDEFKLTVQQDSGSSINLAAGSQANWVFMWFIGK